MGKTTTYSKDRVRFDDGARGYQSVAHHPDGRTELLEVVILRDARGQKVRHVYGRKACYRDGVFGLSDLHGRTWKLEDVEVGGRAVRLTTDGPLRRPGRPVFLDDDERLMDDRSGLHAAVARLGWSRADLARETGYTRRTVESWFSTRMIPTEALNVLADALRKGK
jgi:hypothetical protein